MPGRALPHLTVHEITDRWRPAFPLLLQVYGRPRAARHAAVAVERSFPAAGTAVPFLTAGLTAPSGEGKEG
ncbi:hypothetical protein ABTY20_03945 [Streptomyces sp. NPDC126497]|uniref:hypothetical protein n=1 Tax=Streptomyces sp. NPDC126497 TaxID=3155313 RepID=UPI00332E4381